MLTRFASFFLLLMMSVLWSACDLAQGIFKAGFGIGILVVVIIIIVLAMIFKGRGRTD